MLSDSELAKRAREALASGVLDRPPRKDSMGLGSTCVPLMVPRKGDRADVFLSGLSPMNAERARKALGRNLNDSGVLRTRQAIVERLVDAGATVIVSRGGERRLSKPDGAYLAESQLTKTAIEYADHLVRNK